MRVADNDIPKIGVFAVELVLGEIHQILSVLDQIGIEMEPSFGGYMIVVEFLDRIEYPFITGPVVFPMPRYPGNPDGLLC